MSMVMPLPTTEELDGDDEKLRGDNKPNSSTMLLIGREICFLLAIGFTTYAAIINSETNSSKGPPATPFFQRGSMVGDFYRGELTDALFRASEADVIFIMYYAPWDAESQAVRWEFEALAHQHYKQVYFAAINCWHPGGECKRTLSKVQQYPKLVAYITHENGIEYKGPRNVRYMSQFLDALIRPIHRIHTHGDLLKLRGTHNAVVVGYLHFERMLGGTAYRTLYDAALKLIELDMTREVAVAVVTSYQTADEMGVSSVPTFRLYLWNETMTEEESVNFLQERHLLPTTKVCVNNHNMKLYFAKEYPFWQCNLLSCRKKEYNGANHGESLAKWVTQNLHQVTVWLTPPGIKSLTLAPYIHDGPVLLMFTPSLSLHYYNMLREIGLEYYNCQNDQSVSYLARYMSHSVIDRLSQNKQLEVMCEKQKAREEKYEIPVQVTSQAWSNASCIKSKKHSKQGSSLWKESSCQADKYLVNRPESPFKPMRSKYDHRSSDALTLFHWQETCRRYRLNRNSKSQHIPDVTTPLDSALTGLACASNKTVTLLAMDSDMNAHFADGLGVDLTRRTDKSAVVIFNANMETLHVLTGEVSRQSLTQFLLDYTAGNLERFLRTESRKSRPINRYELPSNKNISSILLPEITTGTFQSVALNNSQNVVVFYHSPYCAFCHGVSYVYLTVARLLRNVPDLLFARLDGDNNDLPWQYTVHHYPSILFFPARRKAESRVFPQHSQLSVNNLAQFVLANLDVEERLLGMLDLCNRWMSKQFLGARRDCIVEVRRNCLNSISDTLTNYRNIMTRKPFSQHRQQTLRRLLYRLRYLKSLHLFLGTARHEDNDLTVAFLRRFRLENETNLIKLNLYRRKDEL